jgi:hypothetical protein
VISGAGPSGNDRGELIAERRAAVAQAPRERLGDQRRLGPVHHVVGDQGDHNREEDQDSEPVLSMPK